MLVPSGRRRTAADGVVGSILSTARDNIDYAWWLVLFPGLAIFTTVAAFNVIGEHARDVGVCLAR